MEKIAIVVEDNAGVRYYLLKLLENAGYKVHAFNNFRSALGCTLETLKNENIRLISVDYDIEGEMRNGLGFLSCLDGLFVEALRLVLSARDDIRGHVESRGYKFALKASPGWAPKLREIIEREG